jgi:PAS domain-containing protein
MRDGWQAGGVVDAPRALSREDEEPDAQLSLRWTQDLARALVDHSADVILVLTADHRCLFANPAIRDRLGYEPDEVLGQ